MLDEAAARRKKIGIRVTLPDLLNSGQDNSGVYYESRREKTIRCLVSTPPESHETPRVKREYDRRVCPAVRRVAAHFDCCPDRLSGEQLEIYFAALVDSHSWSTVKVDRLGLQFFWQHVLKRDWRWLEIIKVPQVRTLPDILTVAEVEKLVGATRHLRYRVFLLATYSMGLRLSETLALATWATSTVNEKWCISVVARATKIEWCHCRT